MPFTNAHHGDDAHREGNTRMDLAARIDAELRARIEDAVDYACLEAMVKSREARGAPAPAADDPRDRDEYVSRVRELLERVRTTLVATLSPEQRAQLDVATKPARSQDMRAALDAQVALARQLPDYWQRFDEIRRQPPAESGSSSGPSGRESRGLLDRFLGR
jgi:hypothetical protein